MADPGPAIALPEWVMGLATAVGIAIAAAVAKLAAKDGAKDKSQVDKVGMFAAMSSAPQFQSQPRIEDALIQTLVALKMSVDKMVDLLERQEAEREEDEKDELKELRRWKADLERSAGEHTRTPRR